MSKEERKALVKEFKATEFGKKAFRNYIIAGIFFFIAVVAEIVIICCDIDARDFDPTVALVFAITCYYEGYYIGAQHLYIKQHEKK